MFYHHCAVVTVSMEDNLYLQSILDLAAENYFLESHVLETSSTQQKEHRRWGESELNQKFSANHKDYLGILVYFK